jgi:hypothetical protein
VGKELVVFITSFLVDVRKAILTFKILKNVCSAVVGSVNDNVHHQSAVS